MHATANRAAGNPLDATAIEISTGGITFGSEGGALGIALRRAGLPRGAGRRGAAGSRGADP